MKDAFDIPSTVTVISYILCLLIVYLLARNIAPVVNFLIMGFYKLFQHHAS
jgi:hypothetical protein